MYRQCLLELAEGSQKFREELWIACSRDLLFFVNAMCWVFEPRESIRLPFITWDFQDRVFLQMDEAIGSRDMGIEKSRDMGLSWIFLTVFFWRWMFRPNQAFGLVSRTEAAVDKKDDPDSLMWKLDFHYRNLPSWMAPRTNRIYLSLKNEENQSTIAGYSAIGDVARGGRKLAFGMDEMASWGIDEGNAAWASTQHVTNSRICPSTPKGKAGIFATQMNNKSADMSKISVHWTEHPDKVPGLYVWPKNQELQIIDTNYKFPSDYEFINDGKLRSPWYDRECRRHPIPALIAQELDIDYAGSGFPFFSSVSVDAHAKDYARDPTATGMLNYSMEHHEPEWYEKENGALRLWIPLTVDGKPPSGREFVIGCDISTGSGGDYSTNSVASVIDRETGEKVAEYAVPDRNPTEFADDVAALRNFFNEAYLGWEVNGPGGQFSKRIMDVSPQRVYYREIDSRLDGKQTKNPGYFTTRENKRVLLGEYGAAIQRNRFVNHSQVALEEMFHYVHFPDGSVDHDRSKSNEDPTTAGANHGDRVIADAIAWKLCSGKVQSNQDSKTNLVENPPAGSMAWRDKMFAEESERAKAETWL